MKELKINQDKDIITLQTDFLTLQLNFPTPLNEYFFYLEHYQKFLYRSSLSSLNLKTKEFDKYYNSLKQQVQSSYKNSLYDVIHSISNLFISIKVAKIEEWRAHNQINENFKKYVYERDTDPYKFMNQNVMKDHQDLLEKMKNYSKEDREKKKSFKHTIEKTTIQLIQYMNRKMDQMETCQVIEPYKAQNSSQIAVNPSKLYSSFINTFKMKSERLKQSEKLQYTGINSTITQYIQFLMSKSLESQKMCEKIIQQYNKKISSSNYSDKEKKEEEFHSEIYAPLCKKNQNQVYDDADDLNGLALWNESPPSLTNRNLLVKFNPQIKIFNQKNSSYKVVKSLIQPDTKDFIRNHKIRIIDNSHFTSKLKNDLLKTRQVQFQQEKFLSTKNILKGPSIKEYIIIKQLTRSLSQGVIFEEDPFENLGKQNIICLLIQRRKKTQTKIWEKFIKKWKNYSGDYCKTEIIEYQQNQSTQNKYKNIFIKELQRKKKNHLFSYKNFITQSKIKENSLRFSNNKEISRYGLVILKEIAENIDTKNVQKFFYYFFKEQINRNQFIKNKNFAENLIYVDSQKFNMRTQKARVFVSQVAKKVSQIQNSLIIWFQDIIHIKRNPKDKSMFYFDCYCFTKVDNILKLLYELRKKFENIKIQEKIIVQEEGQNLEQIQNITSKVYLVFSLSIMSENPTIKQAAKFNSKLGSEIASKIVDCLDERTKTED